MLIRRLAPMLVLTLLAGCAGERSDEGSTFHLGMPHLPLPHMGTPLFLRDPTGTYRGTLEKAIYAGRMSQLWGDVSLSRDCEIQGETKLEVVAAPQHGTTDIKPGRMYAVYPDGDAHAGCSGRLVEGVLAFYTPAPGFLGVDQAVLRGTNADGNVRVVTVNITVSPPPPRPVRVPRRAPVEAVPQPMTPVEAPRPRQAPTDPDAPVPTAPQ